MQGSRDGVDFCNRDPYCIFVLINHSLSCISHLILRASLKKMFPTVASISPVTYETHAGAHVK